MRGDGGDGAPSLVSGTFLRSPRFNPSGDDLQSGGEGGALVIFIRTHFVESRIRSPIAVIRCSV